MKKNGTTFSRTADGTDLCDTKGSVEGIPAADGYACWTQLELAALYGYIILCTVGGEFLQFYYTLADQPQSIDLIKFAKKWIWAFKYSNG